MDIDHLQEKERRDVMAQMADLYYNQGKTQSEIAAHFGTNRFRVARMIQEAREERIVEIRIYFSDERNKALEEELKKCLKLKDVLVVNTRRSSYIDGLAQIGEAGADYLARILEQGAYLGVSWGKTLHSVISRLPDMHYHPVTAAGRILPNDQSCGGRQRADTDGCIKVRRKLSLFGYPLICAGSGAESQAVEGTGAGALSAEH